MRLFFPIYCFIELWLLITIGGEIGALATITWIVLSAVIGVNLLRVVGFEQVSQLLPRAMGAVALIIPGFLSDALGILLTLGLGRKLISKWLPMNETGNASDSQTSHSKNTIEGEFKREE